MDKNIGNIEVKRKFYEDLEKEFNEGFEESKKISHFILNPLVEELKDRFSKALVLEIGVGSGVDLVIFEENEIKTKGIDISPEMIEIAKKNSPKTEFIIGDFLVYEFGYAKFDGINGKDLIHLFKKEDISSIMSKVRSLLNDNGVTLFSFLFNDIRRDELLREAEKNNLGVIKEYSMGKGNRKIVNFLFEKVQVL